MNASVETKSFANTEAFLNQCDMLADGKLFLAFTMPKLGITIRIALNENDVRIIKEAVNEPENRTA